MISKSGKILKNIVQIDSDRPTIMPEVEKKQKMIESIKLEKMYKNIDQLNKIPNKMFDIFVEGNMYKKTEKILLMYRVRVGLPIASLGDC